MKYRYWIGSLLFLLTGACGETDGAADKNPMATFVTSMGDFSVELYPDKAPVTVKNFLDYAGEGFYDNTLFHRVVPNFVIQGGGFSPGMKNKPISRAAIQNEADNGLENLMGTIAMARTSKPHSATSQFFINLKSNFALNHRSKQPGRWGYAVFGKVIRGMDVVQKIGRVKTGSRSGHGDVPVKDVVIKKVLVGEAFAGTREAVKTYINEKLVQVLGRTGRERPGKSENW